MRPFPKDHPGHDVWPPAAVKTPKPHLRVTAATCGNRDCPICAVEEVAR